MKRLLLISILMSALFSMAACGEGGEQPSDPGQTETPQTPDNDDNTVGPGGNGRCVVLYASRSGNTERVAQSIGGMLEGDLLRIEPATPYESDYGAMLERAQEELAAIRRGNYPPAGTTVESLDAYDIVFVGYPVWYGSMATPMQAFLHEHADKLAGKRVALFATSGSSGIAGSVGEARALCPEATFVEPALLLTSSGLAQTENRVAAWLEQIGILSNGERLVKTERE